MMNLEPLVVANEPWIRFGFFLGVFVLVATWELLSPRRTLLLPRKTRWISNLGIVLINTVIVRLVFPTAAVGVAAFCATKGWGLLNYYILPKYLAMLLAVVAMDFVIWLQHVMAHAIPLIWRLHRVHHADLDYDLTTGSRFHPIEILMSMLVKFAAIVVLGPSVMAVLIFEIMLNATAMFNHGNFRLPVSLDKFLRLFLVTPDMHRVHHSVIEDECNSNFGFNLPWWDRLFGTYTAHAREPQISMQIGLLWHSNPAEVARLDGMLLMPFKSASDAYAINRRKN